MDNNIDINKDQYKDFLIKKFGGEHLAGFKYLVYILDNCGDKNFKNSYTKAEEYFKIPYSSIERNIRYYIEYITSNKGKMKIYDMAKIVKLDDNNQITNKRFIKEIRDIIEERI